MLHNGAGLLRENGPKIKPVAGTTLRGCSSLSQQQGVLRRTLSFESQGIAGTEAPLCPISPENRKILHNTGGVIERKWTVMSNLRSVHFGHVVQGRRNARVLRAVDFLKDFETLLEQRQRLLQLPLKQKNRSITGRGY